MVAFQKNTWVFSQEWLCVQTILEIFSHMWLSSKEYLVCNLSGSLHSKTQLVD